MQFQYERKRIKRVKKNQAGLGKARYKVTSAFPYHLHKHYAKVMFEDRQPTDVPSIEVIEYIVDVPHDEMEEKDSFHMVVVSNPTPEYNEKMLESTEKECRFGSGSSSIPGPRVCSTNHFGCFVSTRRPCDETQQSTDFRHNNSIMFYL
jgi:hypothetical protein